MKSAEISSENWWHNFKESLRRCDKTLWLTIFVLVAAGMVMVYSASYIYAQEKFGDGLYLFKRHLGFMALGILAFVLGFQVRTNFLYRHSVRILAAAGVLLFATLIPGLSHKAGGASRWLRLGFFSIQPSEFAKIAVIIYLASQLQRKAHSTPNWRTGFAAYFISALPLYALLLLQPDFGTTALLLITTVFVLVAGGVRIRYVATVVGMLVPTVSYLILSSPYRRARLQAFLDPWLDASGKGFQVIQSLIAIYSGRWFGVGMGNSKEKLFYLPEAHNDFIFAVIGEELGFLGILFFVGLFLIIVTKGLQSARTARTMFDRGLCVGIATMFGLQAFFNMGVVLGLLPTKGLPLPLVSYGGTSFVCTLFLLGILLQLSQGKKA